MRRAILSIIPFLCVAFTCLLSAQDQTPVPVAQAETFVLTKPQLVALQALNGSRVEWRYVWDWASTLQSSPVLVVDDDEWKGKVPIYGVKGHTWLTDDTTLEVLPAFPDIRSVDIAYCYEVTDKGIAHLTKLKSLRELSMYRNAARYGGNKLPPWLPHEKAQNMPQRLTDQSLEHLCGMQQLESLLIWDNEFSERAILKLGQIKTLKVLGIRDSQISDDGLKQLRDMLPACRFDGVSVQRERSAERPKDSAADGQDIGLQAARPMMPLGRSH